MKAKTYQNSKRAKSILGKTKIAFTLIASLLFTGLFAQDRTTVNATNSEISDNLDLRAVASIFGDSKNLDDFERRLNDPKAQISNLDLNNDNQVDYLRVIESVEGNTHLIVIQSVLGQDKYQDVATVEVEKDASNQVQVQVVGDVYMYGRNYIYEPVYITRPVIYDYFWVPSYRPYCSTWYWGYYPSYYYVWSPFPLFRYRHHIGLCINFTNHYNYVNYRRCAAVYNNYYGRRGNYCERVYPNRSFEQRNSRYTNRYELDQNRKRHDVAFNDSGVRSTRNFDNPREENVGTPRANTANSPRTSSSNESPRNTYDTPRNNPNSYATDTPRSNPSNPRNDPNSYATDIPRNNHGTPRNDPNSYATDIPRNNHSTPRSNNSYQDMTPRNNSYATPRSIGNSASPRNYDPTPRNFGGNTHQNAAPRSFGGGSIGSPTPRNSSGGGRR